ncbi:MAG: hypothetical protein KAQ62_03820 [Cyclobacteriaceae bacterium]|nr:hypothetical protein [Cyclobacteriaceae bacterium]MCK5467210.1 hypothetical protein [Cyclobacteriaceae bacterium]
MDINTNWNKIRIHFSKSFRSNFHVSIASVDSENNPTITPIGSLFLNKNLTGFYFEKYPSKLPIYAKINRKICVMAVNSSMWFWIKSLIKGKFNNYPAIKLYGELGQKREATKIEITRLNRRMKTTKGMKGNTYLWGDMKFVREISFKKAEKINLGEMTKDL